MALSTLDREAAPRAPGQEGFLATLEHENACPISLSSRRAERPVRERLVRHGCRHYNPELRRIAIQQNLQAVRTLSACLDAAGGREIELGELSELCSASLQLLLRDRDSMLTVPLSRAEELQASSRRLEVSLLAMALGVELGCSEADVSRIGLAGLLHNGNSSSARIKSVPADVAQILRDVRACRGTRAVPRHRRRPANPFAQVVYVAARFVELKSPRPGRRTLSPAKALRRLLRQEGGSSSQPVLRALLRVLSLFPIGSRVRLSNGCEARVVRATPEDFTRPTVQFLTDSTGDSRADGDLVDLTCVDLQIVEVLED